MKENESALYSQYIIDGTRYDTTPAELLEECMEDCGDGLQSGFDDIVDETMEPPLTSFQHDSSRNMDYLTTLRGTAQGDGPFRMMYPEHFTRLLIAKALISRLWSNGHFRLGDLRMWAQWDWNTRPTGSMAAFYTSAMNASSYLYDLGVKLEDYVFIENDETAGARFFAWLPEENITTDGDDEREDTSEGLFRSSPYESRHPWIGEERKCPEKMKAETDSWLIYIPFDTCRHKLGGSLLAQVKGHNGGMAPSIADPDYFIDCYEVVRELVEDGFVLAGATVAEGGLGAAADRMCTECGADMDLSGLIASYDEQDTTKLLFSEIPGVLMQIRDCDFDYADSQFLLQDVAYYPVGRYTAAHKGLGFTEGGRSGVADILTSLLGYASEGED